MGCCSPAVQVTEMAAVLHTAVEENVIEGLEST